MAKHEKINKTDVKLYSNKQDKYKNVSQITAYKLKFNPRFTKLNDKKQIEDDYPFNTLDLYYKTGKNNLVKRADAEVYLVNSNTFVTDLYSYNSDYIYLKKDSVIYQNNKSVFDKYYYTDDYGVKIAVKKLDFIVVPETIDIFKNSNKILKKYEQDTKITAAAAAQKIEKLVKNNKPYIIVGNSIYINSDKTKVTENFMKTDMS